jgi:two-component system, NarL family, nitrate/nitrite response regulator NarL
VAAAEIDAAPDARVRVLLADDHPIYREGLARVIKLRPELELVGEASDGAQALEMTEAIRPDVAVLDVAMPHLDGLAVLNAIERDHLQTRVLFLSALVDSEVVYKAIATGAGGYLSKEADRDAICDALVSIAHGRTVIGSEIQGVLAGHIRRHGERERPQLTAREREVLQLMAEGRSAPEMAEQLFLSPATVRTHIQTLYEKLEVSDRAAAVATAMRIGLLE